MTEDEMKSRARTREMRLEVRTVGEGDDAKKFVRVSVSSETPCPGFVYDADDGAWLRAFEVLGHGEGEIDFSRMDGGLVIQDTHFGDQIGLIREVEVKDGKLGGVIDFCHGERAQEIRKDAEAGLRRNMSVGYYVSAWEKISDGDKKAGVPPTYRAVKWTPYEASFVNVPADTRVGVDRAADMTQTNTAAETAAKQKERNSEMEKPVETPAVENPADVKIRALEDEVKSLRERMEKPEVPAARAKPQFDEGDEKKITRNYNLMNAVRALAGEKVDCGFERELSDEIARKTKREARGFFIPEAAFRDTLLGKTNVTDHIVGNGGATVQTSLLADQFIDALVAKTVLAEAGASVMSGLVGDVAIPKGGSVSAVWISAEDGDAAKNAPTFSQITATPHTIAARTDISRKLMLQSSVSVQAKVTGWIMDAIARGIEAAAFAGTGKNGQPTGLAATAGVNALALTANAPTHAELVYAWKQLYTENVNGSLKFIGSPAVKALLCKTRDALFFNNTGAKANASVVGGLNGDYLCTKDGKVQGYDFIMSNLCDATKLYFGDWSQMSLLFWSGVDLTVDPYSLSTNGALRLVAFQDCDVVVRQPKAFTVGTAISAG